jgi:poly(A) polymerase
MRTSEEIYHRVRWDSRLDAARFVLGIDVHGRAPKRVPLASFVPGGDYPWHRVIFIEADGERVWDRRSGLDRLDAVDVGRVRAPQRFCAPFYSPRAPFRWDDARSRWVEAHASGDGDRSLESRTLRVLTWNTLWDRYDAERIDTARRRPLLLDALRAADADLIALQEVEPPLLEALMQADWVRERYTLSEGPEARDVER